MVPNCEFIDGFLVFGKSKKGIYISKGYLVDVPDKFASSESTKLEFRRKLTRMLTIILRDGFDIQVKRSFDSDYSSIIDEYRNNSEGGNQWSDTVRRKTAEVYEEAVDNNFLRREYMQIYVGQWYKFTDKEVSKKQIKTFLISIESLYNTISHVLKSAFDDGTVIAMENRDYFERYFKMFNKSFRSNFTKNVGKGAYIEGLSMQDNCMLSDFQESGESVSGLELDGYHHAFLTVARWPDFTVPMISKKLTDMSINDFELTFSLYSTDLEKEKIEGKSVLRNLKNSEDIEEQEMYAALDEKLRSLAAGSITPLYGVFTISVWSRSKDDLKIQMDAVKTNIMAMDGALYFIENAPKKAREIFYMGFPGWMGSSYVAHRKLYAEASYSADLLPISSSFTGMLDKPDAIFDGEEGSIVGIKLFQGSTPSHFGMFGKTRAGKSVTAIAILSQAYPSLGYMVIVESGNSYLTWVKAQGRDAESIVIQPNGNITINYFDTMGLPLTSEQLNNAVGLLMCIIGASSDEDKNTRRQALLTQAVVNLYEDKYNQWKIRNEKLNEQVRKTAVAIHRLQEELPAGANSYVEAYKEYRSLHENNPEEFERRYNAVTEADAADFEKSPRTRGEVMNLAYAMFKPEEFPTHGNFCENLRAGEGSEDTKKEMVALADLLEQWRRNGPNGPLIDGPSTVRIDKRVVHFELGLIPEANEALRNLAGFLINNMVRNHVQSLPRSVKKLFIFEELSRFLNIQGSDKIIKETFAQMGKFACCVGTVTQQYAQFLENIDVAKVCIGNSSQFFLLKNERDDLESLGEFIDLPKVSIEKITNFARPVDLPSDDRYSSFLYFSNTGANLINGVVRVYATSELLYVADSEGEAYQQRMDELKGAGPDDIVDRILEITEPKLEVV